MKRKKESSGVWQYLEQSGVLERGTPEQLAEARREYWRLYKRHWKRKNHKAYTLTLTIAESVELATAAKKHHTAPTAFIKQAFLAYLHTSFVVPDAASIQEIRLLLAQNYLALQKISEDQITRIDAAEILGRMFRLENEVLQQLLQPLLLETYFAKAVEDNPAWRDRLLKILQSGNL